MALVKTTALGNRKGGHVAPLAPPIPKAKKTLTKARMPISREKAAERVAAATMELASGVAESAAAAAKINARPTARQVKQAEWPGSLHWPAPVVAA